MKVLKFMPMIVLALGLSACGAPEGHLSGVQANGPMAAFTATEEIRWRFFLVEKSLRAFPPVIAVCCAHAKRTLAA